MKCTVTDWWFCAMGLGGIVVPCSCAVCDWPDSLDSVRVSRNEREEQWTWCHGTRVYLRESLQQWICREAQVVSVICGLISAGRGHSRGSCSFGCSLLLHGQEFCCCWSSCGSVGFQMKSTCERHICPLNDNSLSISGLDRPKQGKMWRACKETSFFQSGPRVLEHCK